MLPMEDLRIAMNEIAALPLIGSSLSTIHPFHAHAEGDRLSVGPELIA